MNYKQIAEMLEDENYREVLKGIFAFETRSLNEEFLEGVVDQFLVEKGMATFLDEDLFEYILKNRPDVRKYW